MLSRLCKQIKCIGNPLISIYLFLYISKKGYETYPDIKDYLYEFIYDYIHLNNINFINNSYNDLNIDYINYNQYKDLFKHPFNWIFQCIFRNSSYEDIDHLFNQMNDSIDSLLLYSIISTCDPSYIARRSNIIIDLIKKSDYNYSLKDDIIRKVMEHIIHYYKNNNNHLSINDIDHIFNSLYDEIKNISNHNIESYLYIMEIFIEFTLTFYNDDETKIKQLIDDIIHQKNHISLNEKHMSRIILSFINHCNNHLHKLMVNDDFFQLLKSIKDKELITDISHCALDKLSLSIRSPIHDQSLINNVFIFLKNLHDSMNIYSLNEEKKKISSIIISFISKVDFGRDVERHLDLLVECRRSFYDIDDVRKFLIHQSLNLAIKTFKIMNGKHSKETLSFVKACIAYSYVTILPLKDIFSRLYLFALGGQVSILNRCLSQADSFFRIAIMSIQEVPHYIDDDKNNINNNKISSQKPSENYLIEFGKYFISLLIHVPGHPEYGPFYLLRGLIKVIKEYPWKEGSTGKIELLTSIISNLSCQWILSKDSNSFKKSLNVSNDYKNDDPLEDNSFLFGYDDESYNNEIKLIIDDAIRIILNDIDYIKSLKGKEGMKIKKSRVSFDLLNQILISSNLNKKLCQLCQQLYINGYKNRTYKNYKKNSLQWLSSSFKGSIYQDLYNNIQSISQKKT